MSNPHTRTAATLLVRNTTLNMGAEVFVSVVLVATVPPLVHWLGTAPFGLYSLAFALIGYLSYLDLGVSRAATQFVSAGLAQNDDRGIRRIVHSATFVNLLIGMVCGLAAFLLVPFLIHTIFQITPALEREARLVFYAVALGVPLYLLQSVFRAILTSYQRFGVISVINSLATSSQLLCAFFLAWRGFGVGTIVFFSVVVRLVAVAAYLGFLLRLMPGLVSRPELNRQDFGALLHFGGWVTVSQLILQMLVYLDRFLLASFLSLDAVTLYSVPYEGMTRLRLIPTSVMATVYPAMSELRSSSSQERLQVYYGSSIRYLLLLLVPGISFLVVFSNDVLSLWMGAAFALKSSVVLKVLAAGFLLNLLAYVSYSVIQAFQVPQLVGKFHLIVSPLYVAVSVLFILRWGIAGAAAAAGLRFALDAVVLFWIAQRYCRCSLESVWSRSLSLILFLGLLLTISFVVDRWAVPGTVGRLALAAAGVIAYFLAAWRYALNAHEKPAIARALNIFSRQATV
jgi:O-antigen/teichoic acid export membrane protein